MQSTKNNQLDALSEASRRSIDRIPASECPFSQEWEASQLTLEFGSLQDALKESKTSLSKSQ
jgi:hypothetical protein